MSFHVLVTGGAGYIGSHVVRALLEGGLDVTVVDDLRQGHAEHVPEGKLVEMGLHQTVHLAALMKEIDCAAVLHFAASACVEESMREPGQYYVNNVGGTLSLLMAMNSAGVRRIVFSSTAAVYGNPRILPIRETDPIRPCNPYGASKATAEEILQWFDAAHDVRSVVLRYFNAAGAEPGLVERHDPETHLIPLLLRAAATGEPFTVYGQDYSTADGTCVRDFVHVQDLADAHMLALTYLLSGGSSETFNVGTGEGHTILELVAVVEAVTGKEVILLFGDRRPGDPETLVASSAKIREEFGWKPAHDLRRMVEDAWRSAAPE